MSCAHEQVDYDPAGRPVCGECGEVLDQATHLVTLEIGPSGPRGVSVPSSIPKDEAPSPTTLSMVDSICDQCEKSGGIQITPEIKDRIVHLIVAYKLSTGMRIVYSYENLIRTALFVLLRETGNTVPASKLIPRFDGKKAPLFRLLSKMNQLMGLRSETIDSTVLVQHCAEVILLRLKNQKTYPIRLLDGLAKRDLLVDVTTLACRILRIYGEYAEQEPIQNLAHALAVTYFAIRYGCEHSPTLKKRDLSLSNCIKDLDLKDSEHAVFRSYEDLKAFAFRSLEEIGIRSSLEEMVIKHLDDIEQRKHSKFHLAKRIKLLNSKP